MAAEGAPGVTVVVPVLDEATTLRDCLDAIAAQDVEMDDVEVLVCDGGSRDGTASVAAEWIAQSGVRHARVVRSDDGSRSGNLNTGLREARGAVLCRVDARSRIPSHYLRRCREVLDGRREVAVVGGRQRTVASPATPVHLGIARALNNRWATGFSAYRRALGSGPSDTVYLGAFRTAELRAAGGWRTGLLVNEDYDLNRRMAHRGLVWFDGSLVVDYVPRSSLGDLLRQYAGFGRAKVRYWMSTGDRPRPRQVAMLSAPLALVAAATAVLVLAPATVRVGTVVAAAFAAAAVEIAGAHAPRAGVRGHVAAVCAVGCIAAGWVCGAWSEMVRRALTGAGHRAGAAQVPPC